MSERETEKMIGRMTENMKDGRKNRRREEEKEEEWELTELSVIRGQYIKKHTCGELHVAMVTLIPSLFIIVMVASEHTGDSRMRVQIYPFGAIDHNFCNDIRSHTHTCAIIENK